jgi:beta-hydroxylase
MMGQFRTTPHEAPAPEAKFGWVKVAPQPAVANENLHRPEDGLPHNDESLPESEVASQVNPISRKLVAMVDWVERKNLAAAIHGSPGIYDPQLFPWTAELQRNWTIVRGELARLMMRGDLGPKQMEVEDDATTVGNDRSWITYPLANYFKTFEENIAHFPETWRLLDRVPGLVSVMFSIFEPGRRIPPHCGPYNGVLRLHLGLIVPEPHERIGIRIGDQVRHWREGEILIFDDTLEHEAWNDTEHTRVVLFVDFLKPLRWPARLLNSLVLRSFLFAPLVREGESHHGWRGRLFRDARALRSYNARKKADVSVSESAPPIDLPSSS